MKKYNIKIILILLGISISIIGIAQDIHFTQNMSQPTFNPALTGIIPGGYDWRITATHRNQWTAVMNDSKYQTNQLSYDQRFYVGDNDFWSIGASTSYDAAGASSLRRITAGISSAYIKSLHTGKYQRHYMSMGVQTSIIQIRFDPSNSIWSKQFTGEGYNTSLPSGEIFTNSQFLENQLHGDLSAGVAYHYIDDANQPTHIPIPYLTVGFSFHHIGGWIKSTYYNASILDKVFYVQPLWRFHATTMLNINRSWYIMPTIVHARQARISETLIGLNFRTNWNTTDFKTLNALQIGCITRWNTNLELDALAPLIRFELNNFISGISYDLNTSKLRAASNFRGGFEFSLTYRQFIYDKNGSPQKRQRVICAF